MKTLTVLACLVALPAPAFAQAAIVGAVRDSSGTPMPGVNVEASSAALIEKTRTALTDATGRYRIEDLRPGTYQVRFTHPGWKAYRLDGIELSGSFTATVDAELTVGPVTDTVTVTTDPSAIDVHSARRELIFSGDLVESLPTTRGYNALLVLIPGVLTTSNDTVTGPATTSFPFHGGRVNEGRLLLDGMTIGSPPSGNSATMYDLDVGQAQEVTFTISGSLGESETGGLVMNIVPKSGGNKTQGSVFASGTGKGLQFDNLTPALMAQGVNAASPYTRVYDFSGTYGGPLTTDRLWYFLSAHTGGSTRNSTNVYYNVNAGDPQAWLYVPDMNRLSYSDRTFESASGRVTAQVTPRNRLSAFWDAQTLCRTCSGATPGQSEPRQVSPEAVGVLGRRLDVTQANWSSPLTDRLLLEAGYSGIFFGVGNFERVGNPTRPLVRVVEQCASGCAANGNIPGLTYRSQDFSVAHTGSYLWQGSMSYVRGMQALKVGYQRMFMTDDRTWMTNDQNLTYRLNNGEPNQLTESISPWVNDARAGADAIYAQQQWTYRQLTLQGAVRFDRAFSWFPAQQEGPSRFLPTPILVPETRGIDSYKDITPRFGATYDVRGDGETALKVMFGKYLEGVGVSGNYAATNPTLRMPQTTPPFGTAGVTRAWTDANHNFVPDCDLLNPNAQDLRSAGRDFCGVVSNVNFGTNVLTNTFDAQLLSGWGVRPSDWDLALSLQQEIGTRSALDVTYTRRSFRGFTVVDNLALQPSDLTPFEITAPIDDRLPRGGGYTVSGLYDVVPEKAGQVDNRVTDASTFGKWDQTFNGLDVTISAHFGRFTLVGGSSTGQTVTDNCDVRARLPELATTTTGTSAFGAGLASSAVTPMSPYCHVEYGILTQLRGLSTFVVPKVDLQLAATFQSKPGAMLAANYAAPNAAVAPSLGRNLSGAASNATINLVEPGAMCGDRINQLDLRVAKTLRFGSTRATLGLDTYNLLNSSAVLAYNNSFVPGGSWLQPMSILTPRFLRLTTQFTW
jgi:hypothetical protein